MNVDDLMEVWKSQDAAPLHGVNETLLRLALRKDEANVRTQLRVARWIVYAGGAVMIGVLAFSVFEMTRQTLTGWDYVYPIFSAACFLSWLAFVRWYYPRMAPPDQSLGFSLRDQLGRHIAQLDMLANKYANPGYLLGNTLLIVAGSVALFFTAVRGNGDPVSAAWTDAEYRDVFFGGFGLQVILAMGGMWVAGRISRRKYLPHKQRLEALLRELDGQE